MDISKKGILSDDSIGAFIFENIVYIIVSIVCTVFLMLVFLIFLTIWICYAQSRKKINPQRLITGKKMEQDQTRTDQLQWKAEPRIKKTIFMINNNFNDEVEQVSENFEIESQFSFDMKKPNHMEVSQIKEKKRQKQQIETRCSGNLDAQKPEIDVTLPIATGNNSSVRNSGFAFDFTKNKHRYNANSELQRPIEMHKTSDFRTNRPNITEF